MAEKIDTSNVQFVGLQGSRIVVLKPRISMSVDEALIHAATLVAVSGKSFDEFKAVYDAVCEC